jgi:hypothetical protein
MSIFPAGYLNSHKDVTDNTIDTVKFLIDLALLFSLALVLDEKTTGTPVATGVLEPPTATPEFHQEEELEKKSDSVVPESISASDVTDIIQDSSVPEINSEQLVSEMSSDPENKAETLEPESESTTSEVKPETTAPEMNLPEENFPGLFREILTTKI